MSELKTRECPRCGNIMGVHRREAAPEITEAMVERAAKVIAFNRNLMADDIARAALAAALEARKERDE